MADGVSRVGDLVNEIRSGTVDKARLMLDLDDLSLPELRQLGRAASTRSPTMPTATLSWMEIAALVRMTISKRVG